jgi:hypothetical protein
VRARVKSSLALAAFGALALMAWAAPGAQAAPMPFRNAIAIAGPSNLPPGVNEMQKVAVDATNGGFKLEFEGKSTVLLAFNESPANVEASLNSLSTIGGAGGSVSVSGGPGDAGGTHPYVVTFGGTLATTNVSQMVANGAGLTGAGHSVSVTTSVGGGTGSGILVTYVQNIGGEKTTDPLEGKITLPAGIVTASTPAVAFESVGSIVPWSCSPTGAGQSVVTCTSPVHLLPGGSDPGPGDDHPRSGQHQRGS